MDKELKLIALGTLTEDLRKIIKRKDNYIGMLEEENSRLVAEMNAYDNEFVSIMRYSGVDNGWS